MVRGAAGGIAALQRLLAEQPDIELDLWDLYRVDVRAVFQGSMLARRVMGLVERLLDEPWSRFRAKLVGGEAWREHLGWGPAEYLQVVLIDVVQANTVVTAHHGTGKRAKPPPPFYRPPAKTEPLVPESLDDLPLDAIEATINR